VNLRVAALELAAKAAWKLHPGSPAPGEPWLVHTRAGIKYVGRGFHSSQFDKYVMRTLDGLPSEFAWDDLVLPPDLLRDEYTHAGEPITRSPHFRLMQELRDNVPGKASEYARLCRTGTLDARRGFAVDIDDLASKFRERAREVARNGEVDVRVFPPCRLADRDVYMIADGKHRAALAAVFGDTRPLRLSIISDDVLAHPFFRKIYDAVMAAPKKRFAVNQRMVEILRR
jgi:hypothetical protein